MDYYNHYGQDVMYRGEEYYTESPRYSNRRVKPRKERSNDYIPSSHYYDNYQEPSSYTEYNDSTRVLSPDRYYAPIQKKQKVSVKKPRKH